MAARTQDRHAAGARLRQPGLVVSVLARRYSWARSAPRRRRARVGGAAASDLCAQLMFSQVAFRLPSRCISSGRAARRRGDEPAGGAAGAARRAPVRHRQPARAVSRMPRRFRAALADALAATARAASPGVMVLLAWHDPRALAVACCSSSSAGVDSVDGSRRAAALAGRGAVLGSLCDTSSFGALPAAYGLRGIGRRDRQRRGRRRVHGCAIRRLRRTWARSVAPGGGRRSRTAVAGCRDVGVRRHPGGDQRPPALAGADPVRRRRAR